MAITFHQDYFRNSAGVKWQIIGKFDLDSSYPAGGYLIDPVQLGLSQIDSVVVNDAAFGYEYNWDKANSKLRVFETSGGGGGVFVGTPAVLTGTNAPSPLMGSADPQVFTGTPAAPTGTNAPSAVTGTADAQAFVGDPMSGHTHNLQIINLSGTHTEWRIYHGAVVGGPFVVGDIVTDGGGGSATVSAVGVGYLDFNAYTAILLNGNPLSGSISGATTTATSVFLGLVTVPSVPLFLSSGSRPLAGLTEGYALNPIPNSQIPDASFEMRFEPTTVRIEANNGGIDSPSTLNDVYAIDFISPVTTSVSAGTPSGTNASSAVSGTASAQVWTGDPYTPAGTNASSPLTGVATAQILTMDPYTPAGIIMGGGGGASPQVEITPGTNLSTVINVEFISFGL